MFIIIRYSDQGIYAGIVCDYIPFKTVFCYIQGEEYLLPYGTWVDLLHIPLYSIYIHLPPRRPPSASGAAVSIIGFGR